MPRVLVSTGGTTNVTVVHTGVTDPARLAPLLRRLTDPERDHILREMEPLSEAPR